MYRVKIISFLVVLLNFNLAITAYAMDQYEVRVHSTDLEANLGQINHGETCCKLAEGAIASGTEWTGWLWAVTLSEEACDQVGLAKWSTPVAAFSIAMNSLAAQKIYNPLLKKCLTPLQPSIRENEKSLLKPILASATSGITFELVDTAVSAACLAGGYSLPVTLTLRCLALYVADRGVFDGTCELVDRVKTGKWFTGAPTNFIDSADVGTASVFYTLGAALGESVCELSDVSNSWIKTGINSCFIFVGTTLSPCLSWAEKKLLRHLLRQSIPPQAET